MKADTPPSSDKPLRHFAAMAFAMFAFGIGQAAAAEAPNNPLVVTSVYFQGQHAIPVQTLQEAIHPYLDQAATPEHLEAMRLAVAKVYDSAGLGPVAVERPVVLLEGKGGVYLCRVVEMPLAAIEFVNPIHPTSERVRAWLPALVPGQLTHLDQLAGQVFLANDNPKRNLAVDFRPEGKAVKAYLTVVEQSPWFGEARLDNTGTPSTGDFRLRLSGGHADLFGRGHILEGSYVTDLDDQLDVHQWQLRYTLPVPAWGSQFGLSVDQADSMLPLSGNLFTVSGKSRGWRVDLRQPLSRATDFEHFLSASLENRRYEDVLDFLGNSLGSNVAERPLSLGYQATSRQSGWGWQVAAQWTHNLSGGRDNDAASYASARYGATPGWDKFSIQGALAHTLENGSQISARLSYQHSNEPLISGEQIRIGGASLLRGLHENELSGDRGGALSLEAALPERSGHTGFVFFDHARLRRLQTLVGEPARLAASTAGVGWRYQHRNGLGLGATLGHILGGDNLPLSKTGGTRVHAYLQWSF